MKHLSGVLSQYSYGKRIVIPVVCTVVILCLVMFLLIMPQYRSGMIERKKELVREQVNTAWSLLDSYYHRVDANDLTEPEAKQLAINQIRTLRYGREMKDYFWINDTIPNLIMHPYRSDLEGTNVADYSDPHGKRLFQEFANLVKEQDEGFVDYMWQWKDDSTRIVPKVSFVKKFRHWGWIIGSGLYVDDVEAEVARLSQNLVLIVVATIGLSLLLLTYTVRQGLHIEKARHQASLALHKSNEQYRTLTENSPDFIARYDSSGRYTFLNAATQQLLGKKTEDVIGRTHREMGFVPELCDFMEASIFSVFSDGEALETEFELRLEKSDARVLNWRLIPEKNQDGDIISVLGVARDISDIREANQKLTEINLELKRTNQELVKRRQEMEEFIHTITHDLKAPIISIQGFSQLLKSRIGNVVDETSLCHFDRISANCRMIESLLNDLLELSRIGRIDENPTIVNTTELIKETIGSFTVIASRKNIHIRTAYEYPNIWGRINRIRQVFINLIDNAIKYMPADRQGIIEIAVVPNLDSLKQRLITFVVRDNGDGITPAEHEKVFKMFQRARKTNDSVEGTGAGLAIVKKIINNHGGSIWLESARGKGASFYFTVPAADDSDIPLSADEKTLHLETARQPA